MVVQEAGQKTLWRTLSWSPKDRQELCRQGLSPVRDWVRRQWWWTAYGESYKLSDKFIIDITQPFSSITITPVIKMVVHNGQTLVYLRNDRGNPRVKFPTPVPIPARTPTHEGTGFSVKTSPRTYKSGKKWLRYGYLINWLYLSQFLSVCMFLGLF